MSPSSRDFYPSIKATRTTRQAAHIVFHTGQDAIKKLVATCTAPRLARSSFGWHPTPQEVDSPLPSHAPSERWTGRRAGDSIPPRHARFRASFVFFFQAVPQTVTTLRAAAAICNRPPHTKPHRLACMLHITWWWLARSCACRQRRGAGAGGAAQRQAWARARPSATRATPAWVPPEPPAPATGRDAARAVFPCGLRTAAKASRAGTHTAARRQTVRCAARGRGAWSMEAVAAGAKRNVAGGIRVLCLRP